MTAKRILKQLTPERVKKELAEVQAVELPADLQKWIKEYEKVGDRDPFIWKWAYRGWEICTLPCVDDAYKEKILFLKMLNTMLNVLIDDIADIAQDQALLEKAIAIIFNNRKKHSDEYLNLIAKIWTKINQEIRELPRFLEFKDIFYFDYYQFVGTIKYSCLLNNCHHLINHFEQNFYTAHNMQGVIGITIDLMASPSFKIKELAVTREIAYKLERMGRIGNIIGTWQNELKNKDFTNDMFSFLIEKKKIAIRDIQNLSNKEIQAIEKYFLKEWGLLSNSLSKKFKNKFYSFNFQDILISAHKFLTMHLISKNKEI